MKERHNLLVAKRQLKGLNISKWKLNRMHDDGEVSHSEYSEETKSLQNRITALKEWITELTIPYLENKLERATEVEEDFSKTCNICHKKMKEDTVNASEDAVSVLYCFECNKVYKIKEEYYEYEELPF